MSNTFQCTAIRYEFFNGKENYTVEFIPALAKWFIFKEHERTNAVQVISVKKEKVCSDSAETHLNNYIDTINTTKP